MSCIITCIETFEFLLLHRRITMLELIKANRMLIDLFDFLLFFWSGESD